jgi:hypothetical protein
MSELLGIIDGQRGLKITADYLLAFFNYTLQGIGTNLLNAPSPAYPEVKFETR